MMPLALVGCDFRIASSTWRGRLVLAPDERRELHAQLERAANARGLAVLDTCNRTEWIVEAPEPEWAAELLRGAMLRRWSGTPSTPAPTPYVHVSDDAARHFLRVAVGLESFVPGEREIGYQCRRALAAARDDRTGSALLDALGAAASRAARRLDRRGVFRQPRGVQDLACAEVVRRLASRDGAREAGPARVGVVGMGQVGRKVAALLPRHGVSVLAFNRTIRNAQDGHWMPLSDLPAQVRTLDALVVATAALAPTVDLDALGAPEELPVLDLGVPHQVAARDGVIDLDALLAAAPMELHRHGQGEVEASATVEECVAEVVTAWRKRGAARLLETAQASRDRVRDAQLPELLDALVPDLEPARRRKLEAALRSLLSDQHREILDEIARATGADVAGARKP